MSVSVRSLLAPAVALTAVGVVTLGSALVAPPAVSIAQPSAQIPTVHIADIALAGIGQDIYYAIQPWVAYGVELVQWATVWIPPVSSQIGILYFAGLQPVVEATVNALAGIVQNPFDIIGVLSGYGTQLGVIGYNFFAAEAAWFGFPLPPIPVPPLASVPARSASAAATRAVPTPLRLAQVVATAVAESPVAESPVAESPVAESPVAESPVAPAVVRPARAARKAPRAAASAVLEAAQRTGAQVSTAAETASETAVSSVRSAARAAGGEVRTAARQARGAAN